jgi:hypothetical protein
MMTPSAGGGPDLAAIQQEVLALREKDAEREREIAERDKKDAEREREIAERDAERDREIADLRERLVG